MEPLDARQAEVTQKLARLRERKSSHDLDAVHLRTNPNTSWLTGGCQTIKRPTILEL